MELQFVFVFFYLEVSTKVAQNYIFEALEKAVKCSMYDLQENNFGKELLIDTVHEVALLNETLRLKC